MSGDSKRKKVNLARLSEPLMLTLTKKPANRSGFKVVRSAPDTEESDMLDLDRMPSRLRRRATATVSGNSVTTPRRSSVTNGARRVSLDNHELSKTKRRDTGLLSLILPKGASADDAADVIESFGLSDDYEVVQDGDHLVLSRKDVEADEIVHIELNDGIIAQVDAAIFEHSPPRTRRERSEVGDGCTLVRLDFDGRKFDESGVAKFLKRYDIDHMEGGVEAVEGGVIVMRHDDYQERDAKRVRLAEGIIGYVVRSDEQDVPAKVRRAVVDQAFGNFGMGHLDFASALADPEFSSRSESAIWQLADVLHNIVFRSGLEMDDRKELITRATTQFSTFMGNLMDNLPTAVVENMKAERDDAPSSVRKRASGGEAGPGGGHMPLMATSDGMGMSAEATVNAGAGFGGSGNGQGDVYATIKAGAVGRQDGNVQDRGADGGSGQAGDGANAQSGSAAAARDADGSAGAGASSDQQTQDGGAGGADNQDGSQRTDGAGGGDAAGGQAGAVPAAIGRDDLIAIVGSVVSEALKPVAAQLGEIDGKVQKTSDGLRKVSRTVRTLGETVDELGAQTVARSDGGDDDWHDADDSGMNGDAGDSATFSGVLGSFGGHVAR